VSIAKAAGLRNQPDHIEDHHRSVDRAITRAERLADVLDRALQIPATNIRFGWDSIIGLVPVVGDTIAALIGLYPVIEAIRFNARITTILRMLLNLAIDWLLGLVPLLDIVLDVAYKANVHNARLLAAELDRQRCSISSARDTQQERDRVANQA
jgi:hypothetical protein